MLNPSRRSLAIGRIVALLILAACLATPASAQFGGLKKKVKGDAAAKAAAEAGADAPAAATGPAATPAGTPAGGDGSIIVLTAEVVDRVLAGLKAGKADRALAAKEDTPYGRYNRDRAAYDAAVATCQAAQQPGIQRMVANQKMADKYSALLDKMLAAQGKQDQRAAAVYQDSALAMIDPSCSVHEPQQPQGYYDMQREVDSRAEQAALKTMDLSATEYGQVSDRVIAILTGAPPPGGASPAEKAAVTAKGAELKSLLGLREAQEGRVSKSAPTPAPPPTPAVDTAPAVPAGASAANECMVQNAQKHEAEIKALGDRGEAASNAGNTPLMMAIADSVNKIMMSGCTGQR
jgi:hypothetical protein